MRRSNVPFVASAASSALYVPMRFTRIVRTGLSITVSTPAIAAAVHDVRRTCERPRRGRARRARRPGRSEVRMVCERRAAERVAVEVVDGDDLVLVDEPARERRPDESGAARDDDALSRQSHAASLDAVSCALHGGSTLGHARAVLLALALSRARRGCVASGWDVGDDIAARSRTGRTRPSRPTADAVGPSAADPPRGSLARPARACTRLAAGGAKLFAPSRRRIVCTEIYGGPQQAASWERRRQRSGRRSRGRTAATSSAGSVSPWLLPPGGVT